MAQADSTQYIYILLTVCGQLSTHPPIASNFLFSLFLLSHCSSHNKLKVYDDDGANRPSDDENIFIHYIIEFEKCCMPHVSFVAADFSTFQRYVATLLSME